LEKLIFLHVIQNNPPEPKGEPISLLVILESNRLLLNLEGKTLSHPGGDAEGEEGPLGENSRGEEGLFGATRGQGGEN
jgi:hypothetical protein